MGPDASDDQRGGGGGVWERGGVDGLGRAGVRDVWAASVSRGADDGLGDGTDAWAKVRGVVSREGVLI